MSHNDFEKYVDEHAADIRFFVDKAHAARVHVNLHLDEVGYTSCPVHCFIKELKDFAPAVCAHPDDILPLYFAVCFHDALTSLRMQYDDVLSIARQRMNEEQALLAANLVYTLTPLKGKKYKDRYSAAFYEEIRQTPYAPLLLACIHLEQFKFMFAEAPRDCYNILFDWQIGLNLFLKNITVPSDDVRLTLPEPFVEHIWNEFNSVPVGF